MTKNRSASKLLLLFAVFAILISMLTACGSNESEETNAHISYKEITTANELNGEKIGIIGGNGYGSVIEENFSESEVASYTMYDELITALKRHEIAAFLVNSSDANNLSTNYPELKTLNEKLDLKSGRVAFSSQNEELRDDFNKYMEKLREEGLLVEVYNKWNDGESDTLSLPKIKNELNDAGDNVFTFAYIEDKKPYTYAYEDTAGGAIIDIVIRYCNEKKMVPQFEVLSLDEIPKALGEGRISAAYLISDNAVENVIYSDAINTVSMKFVTLADQAPVIPEQRFTEISQLEGRKIGIIKDSGLTDVVKGSIDGIDIVSFDSYDDCIDSLMRGDIAAVAARKAAVMDILTDNNDRNLTYISDALSGSSYVFAFNTGDGLLCSRVNQALEEMNNDGTIDALERKWISEDEGTKALAPITLTGENGTLRYATNSAHYPFCYRQNGEIVGYEIDIVNNIASRMGYNLEITDMNDSVLLSSLTLRNSDMAGGCLTVRSTGTTVIYSDIYYNAGIVMMVAGEPQTFDEKYDYFFNNMLEQLTLTFIDGGGALVLLSGFGVTLLIFIASLFFGNALGLLLCIIKKKLGRVVNTIVDAVIIFIDRMPLVIMLMLLWFVFFGGNEGASAILVAIIGISVWFGGKLAVMLIEKLDDIPYSQIESAYLLGLNDYDVLATVQIPQAFDSIIANYYRLVIEMFKAISVVGFITVTDITMAGKTISESGNTGPFAVITAAIVYFLATTLLVKCLRLLTVRLRKLSPEKVLDGVRIR